MKPFLSLLLFYFSISCFAQNTPSFSKDIVVVGYTEKKLQDSIIQTWQHKDIVLDTIPGVSTDKAYNNLLSKRGDTIIVAVIDTGIDIEHEDLKEQIWNNPKETANNGIDDDGNGYIDDIHGWNFLGNKKGINIYYARSEYVRVLADKGYLTKKGLLVPKEETDSILLKAAEFYTKAKKKLEKNKEFVAKQKIDYKKINTQLKSYFPNNEYSLEKLKTIDTIQHPKLKYVVKKLSRFLKYEVTPEWLEEYENDNKVRENYNLNHSYDDRKLVGDNLQNIKDTNYGNNNVIGDNNIDSHGTMVAGIISASRNNKTGIKGIADKARIMALRAVPLGDEYDKDIALAIRYAVDNGAKIINMSFGKSFSPDYKLVIDAIVYAAKNDVLIIHGSGNDSNNIDLETFYPMDYDENSKEVSQNFINVGALNYKLNRKFPAYFSNYGKNNVDVFAPGYELYTTLPKNKYVSANGTSFAAPIVSGIAALIRSRYPNLTAPEVKNIIINSGNSYNLSVTIPGKRKDSKVLFSELSKSGKIVNAYNALLMAEEIAKGKN